MTHHDAPAGVILTGGASRRMGADKALVAVDGAPMVVRVADALWEAGCHPVQCQGGDIDAIAELGLEAYPDPQPGAGPVAAIHAAARRLGRAIVVAACDLADLDAASVGAVIDEGRRSGVAVAVSDGHRHLLSYWAGADLLDAGPCADASYRDALDRAGAVEVPVAPAAMRNVNHPDDLVSHRYPRADMSIQEISVDELAEHLAAGAPLVDVREPDEYRDARVPGGQLVPLGTVPGNIDAFRHDGPTYVICRSGGRSMQACEFLAEQGVSAVNVAGGTLAWIASGREVATGDA